MTMSNQLRIHLFPFLRAPQIDRTRRLRTPEDETKLSTMLYWISNVIIQLILSHNASSGRLVLLLFWFHGCLYEQLYMLVGYYVILNLDRRETILSRRVPGFLESSPMSAGNGYRTKFPTFQSCHMVQMFRWFWRIVEACKAWHWPPWEEPQKKLMKKTKPQPLSPMIL
jgi:hypothetical protein